MNSKISAVRSGAALLKETGTHWMEDNALRLSAALAYYSIFSIAPLLVLAVGLAGIFFGAEAVRGELYGELKGMVGSQAAAAVQSMVQSTSQPSQSITATVVGLVTLFIGASGVFGQLKDALNTIWEIRARPGLGVKAFLRERLLSFGMVLVVGFLLLVSFLLTTVLTAFSHWIENILKAPAWLWGGAGFVASFAVITLLFAMIFKVLPDVKIAWRHVWVGAATTGLFFEIGKFGLAFYLGRASTASGFGSAASVVLLLLWVYYASCILLFGAEFTKVYAAAHGARLRPTEFAEPVTAEARAQQGMKPEKETAPGIAPPRREFLAAIFPPPPRAPVPPFPRRLGEVRGYVAGHPAASLAAALGCGLTAGLISRTAGNRTETPSAQLQKGSRLLATALLVLGMRFGKQIAGGIRKILADGALRTASRWLPGR